MPWPFVGSMSSKDGSGSIELKEFIVVLSRYTAVSWPKAASGDTPHVRIEPWKYVRMYNNIYI